MTGPESDGVAWLVERIKWEQTLQSLHEGAGHTVRCEEVARAPSHAGRLAAFARRWMTTRKSRGWAPSPVRGMSRRSGVFKIRA